MTSPISAANAYAALSRLYDPAATAKSGGGTPETSSFGSMLKNAIGALNQTARTTDTQTQAMAAGNANIVDVVTAVAETEVAIDALVSVRDRAIQSYEEIMKIQI